MNNKSCAANDKNIAVSKETELLKKYWNHVSKKASRYVLGLCKNYFLMSFLPLFNFRVVLPPKTVAVHSSLPITPHSLQPHQTLYCGQGLLKLPKEQKMWGSCPGSTPLQTACPHWGAATEKGGFCRADRENEAGESAVLRDLGWQGSEPVERKEFVWSLNGEQSVALEKKRKEFK